MPSDVLHDVLGFPDYVRDDPRNWWACEFPERRVTDYTLYDLDNCRGCCLALRAAARNGFGDHRLWEDSLEESSTINDLIERLPY